MVQVRLWTIVGPPRTGKSRTVRELASLSESGGPPKFAYIPLRGGGYLRVYAKRMAWQENMKSPADSIAEINRKIAVLTRRLGGAPFALNVLSTLRFDPITHSRTITCPSGGEYLRQWAAEGWQLESLVLMSPDKEDRHDFYGEFGAPTAWLYDSRAMTAGEMVGAVRNHFGWA